MAGLSFALFGKLFMLLSAIQTSLHAVPYAGLPAE